MTKPRQLRFLFTTFDGGGNVAPVMGVVEKLVRRGHLVRVMSDGATRDEAEAAGAGFLGWRRAPNKPTRARDTAFGDWAVSTPGELVKLLVGGWMCGHALAYARDVIEELEREPADLVVNFDMLLGVIAGCEARGQRLALLSTCIAHAPFELAGQPPFGAGLAPPRTEADHELHAAVRHAATALIDAELPQFNAVRRELGLAPLQHLSGQVDAASARFLGTARAFDFPCELPANVRYAGPLVRDPVWVGDWTAPWPATERRPLVLVGFSTSFQNHAACLQRVIDACASLPVRVLVTLGGAILQDELRPADNTVIRDSAPHDIVMRDASLVVTHGGHGTVMTALLHRLPMLVLPHGRDQGDNAARITERGAGLALPNSATVEAMRAAIVRLLDEPGFGRQASRLGEAVAAEVAASTLIADLERLASGQRLPG